VVPYTSPSLYEILVASNGWLVTLFCHPPGENGTSVIFKSDQVTSPQQAG